MGGSGDSGRAQVGRSKLARAWQALRPPTGTASYGVAPPRRTPLAGLAAIVIDTETTGLNVRSDRVISAAGFRLAGGRLGAEPVFDRLIDPGMPIPPASSVFHGITDAMVRGAGDFAAHWPELHQGLQAGLVIGHQVYFDLAILRREARRLGIGLQPPVAIDTALLYAALHPGSRAHDLTPCCAALGIEVRGRHTARGDAEAAGRLFLELLPLLEQHGITTLGEALAFERASLRRHARRPHWS